MKIAVCGDIHISKTSSIIRSRGEKYSTRIENCIQSINWFEDYSKDCDLVIYLGDVFDSPILDDEIITALKDIKWNNLKHYFIVGNHESSTNNLVYSSLNVLSKQHENFVVVNQPTMIEGDIGLLPYIIESDRKSLNSYFDNPKYIFSHNDLKGVQMGSIISRTGFELDEINDMESLKYFINGHLHNGTKVDDKIINLGILTGRDFGEDATRYTHNIMILNEDGYELVENPYAFNFYKREFNNGFDVKFKTNAVVSVRCPSERANEIKKLLNSNKNVVAYKLNITFESNEENQENISFNIDYLNELKNFCLDKIGNNEVVIEELQEVCK